MYCDLVIFQSFVILCAEEKIRAKVKTKIDLQNAFSPRKVGFMNSLSTFFYWTFRLSGFIVLSVFPYLCTELFWLPV